jgi:hypothetical protein
LFLTHGEVHILNALRNARTCSWLALTLSLAIASASTDAIAANHLPTLSKQCGQATATITCTAQSSEYRGYPMCVSTKLDIKAADGKKVAPPKPKGLEEHTATGLQCTKSKEGGAYFYVEYSDLPVGCKMCEWIAIYNERGALLTNNDPPVLHDPELPPQDPYRPNNDEFSTMSDKLGLPKVDMDYIH